MKKKIIIILLCNFWCKIDDTRIRWIQLATNLYVKEWFDEQWTDMLITFTWLDTNLFNIKHSKPSNHHHKTSSLSLSLSKPKPPPPFFLQSTSTSSSLFNRKTRNTNMYNDRTITIFKLFQKVYFAMLGLSWEVPTGGDRRWMYVIYETIIFFFFFDF